MHPQHSNGTDFVTHYSILGLPSPLKNHRDSITKDGLRNAYHKALLLNHPDKNASNESDTAAVPHTKEARHQHSIDEILTAYQTLADPRLKSEYDQWLLAAQTQRRAFQGERSETGTHAGVDVYDLEDLSYSEERGIWSKSCRCGEEEGYVLREQDLEHEIKEGEIFVGCHGCSLYIKVLFTSVNEDGEEGIQ